MPIPASFSAKQRALIEKLRGERAPIAASAIPRLAPGSRTECSFAQERLWILEQLDPDTPLYNVPLALRLQGPLDVVALDRALLAILCRHAALRAVFPEANGRPAPHLTATPRGAIETRDLTSMPQDEQVMAVAEMLRDEAERPFQLAEGPLTRALLLRTGPESHFLSITMHHIVCDAWSIQVLLRELS